MSSSFSTKAGWPLGVLAVAIGSAIGVSMWSRGSLDEGPELDPEPPAVDLRGADPAVVRVIESALSAVRRKPESADTWGKAGMTLMAHGLKDPAALCFRQAAARDPAEPRWPYLRALSLIQLDADTAVIELKRAAELCGDEPEAPRLRLVELLLELYRLEEAESQLKPFLRNRTGSARAHLAMARLHALRGRHKDCLESLEEAYRHGGARKSIGLLMAEAYRRLGQLEKAEERRRQASDLSDAPWPDPFSAEVANLTAGLKALLSRADVAFGGGKLDESIELLRRAVEQYPDSDWARILLGRGLIRKRRLEEAEQVLAGALKLAPNSVEALFRMGVAKSYQDRYREAVSWFAKAVELKPDFTMGYYNLGFCLDRLGDRDRAIEAYRSVVRCEPNYLQAHAALGKLLAEQGQRDDAIGHLEIVLKLKPGDRWTTELLRQLRASGRGESSRP